MAIKARYKGDGTEFHHGIPARNLTEEEFEALDVEERKMLRQSPLYDVVPDNKLHESASKKEDN
jgi:hypothetical protein